MIVMRLETEDGVGVFKYGAAYGLYKHGTDPYCKPEPQEEGLPHLGYPNRHLFCGFISTYQLRRWFNKKQREVLVQRDIKIAMYEVNESDLHIGKLQVVFKREEKKLICRVSADSI